MRITKVVTDKKRHTLGFMISFPKYMGTFYLTRGQVVKMARRKQIKTVIAKRGQDGWYVCTTPNMPRRNLYDLPIQVV